MSQHVRCAAAAAPIAHRIDSPVPPHAEQRASGQWRARRRGEVGSRRSGTTEVRPGW